MCCKFLYGQCVIPENIHTPPTDGSSDNPHILKYVSYDRLRLLQPCGKLFSWAPPVPLGNFYPLEPPPHLGISIDHPWGGGYGYFLELHNLFQKEGMGGKQSCH